MTQTEDSDEVLIGRYSRGEAAAFDLLYKRHELSVWRYLERNVGDQATSEELLQDVWLALARNAASFDTTRFRTRLFTLAHDRMSTALRERPAKASATSANGLTAAVSQLTKEERETYLLHIEGKLSLGEIAEITESTVDAVESRLRLSRLKLNELLDKPQ